MIFKKLTSMCKKRKTISMFEDDDNHLKWLSAGAVAVCLGEGCTLSTDDILFFLEVPEERKQRYFVRYEHEKTLPDATAAEDVERLIYNIQTDSKTLQPFKTSMGALLVDVKSLEIFADIKDDVEYKFTYWDNMPVLLVMQWTNIIGIIMPVKQDYKILVNFAADLYDLSSTARDNNFISIDGKQVSLYDDEAVDGV